jgi:hypothetical protein
MTTDALLAPARPVGAPSGAASRVASRGSALLAAVSMTGLTAASFLVVLIAAERPSTFTPTSAGGYFPAWMAGPLSGLLPGLTRNDDRLAWLLSGVMLASYALYVVAFRLADRIRARWTVAALLAIHLAFLLSPPLQYTDVFNYIHYGRMGVLHGLNPYTVSPALSPHGDPSFALGNWHHLLSPYGPAFTLFSYALVPLGVDHNDSIMVVFLVFAVYLALRAPAASRAVGAALVLAVFVKASAAVVLPVFLAAGQRSGLVRGGLAAAALLGRLR